MIIHQIQNTMVLKNVHTAFQSWPLVHHSIREPWSSCWGQGLSVLSLYKNSKFFYSSVKKKKTDVHWQYYSSSNHSQKILLSTVLKWYVTDLKKLKQKETFIAQWVSSCIMNVEYIFMKFTDMNKIIWSFKNIQFLLLTNTLNTITPSSPPPPPPPTHTHTTTYPHTLITFILT